MVLADNLLGDNLNPIFSTAEFHNLPALEELDLSGNSIRGLEEGLLIGCDVLKVCINIVILYISKYLACSVKRDISLPASAVSASLV